MVKMECTLHVLLNIDPKLRVNPVMRLQALAVHTYGKLASVVRLESRPRRMTEM